MSTVDSIIMGFPFYIIPLKTGCALGCSLYETYLIELQYREVQSPAYMERNGKSVVVRLTFPASCVDFIGHRADVSSILLKTWQ